MSTIAGKCADAHGAHLRWCQAALFDGSLRDKSRRELALVPDTQ